MLLSAFMNKNFLKNMCLCGKILYNITEYKTYQMRGYYCNYFLTGGNAMKRLRKAVSLLLSVCIVMSIFTAFPIVQTEAAGGSYTNS